MIIRVIIILIISQPKIGPTTLKDSILSFISFAPESKCSSCYQLQCAASKYVEEKFHFHLADLCTARHSHCCRVPIFHCFSKFSQNIPLLLQMQTATKWPPDHPCDAIEHDIWKAKAEACLTVNDFHNFSWDKRIKEQFPNFMEESPIIQYIGILPLNQGHKNWCQ